MAEEQTEQKIKTFFDNTTEVEQFLEKVGSIVAINLTTLQLFLVDRKEEHGKKMRETKKVWFCPENITTDFLSFEELVSRMTTFKIKGVSELKEVKMFHPVSNRDGIINKAFFPFCLLIRHKKGILICDRDFNSYPERLLDELIMYNDDLEQIKKAHEEMLAKGELDEGEPKEKENDVVKSAEDKP